jgi:DNA (cytosine-5)-methyltransferase 3A
MNVLSLFDGMSCGQIALSQLSIKVDNFYASEIDKYAITITQKNFPNTIQLGDITKWREWDIDWLSIDLVFGGSPCQGFSFAGKQLAFDDPRSKLFFVFIDILNHVKQYNPKVKFLLENVRMKKEYQDVITSYIGVEPVMINSALVSAQNRVRYYWTNITELQQPQDRGILLKDIIESGKVEENKARTIDANYFKGGKIGGTHQSSIRGRYNETGKTEQKLEVQYTGRANSITTVQKDSLCVKEATKKGYAEARIGEGLDLTFPSSKTRRGRLMKYKSNCLTSANYEYGVVEKIANVNPSGKGMNGQVYSIDAKSPTVTSNKGEGSKISEDRLTWRKLTPLECERLQTVPDDYTLGVSNSQRYKMLGNGWTVEVIKHIFKNLSSTDRK